MMLICGADPAVRHNDNRLPLEEAQVCIWSILHHNYRNDNNDSLYLLQIMRYTMHMSDNMLYAV